jgi:ATP-binding cassette subfamily B protein
MPAQRSNVGKMGMSDKTDKPKDTKYVLRRLGRYIYQYKWLLTMAIALTIGSNLLALIGPMLSGYAIDAIQPGKGLVVFHKVFYYAGWMILFYVISSILSYLLSILMIRLSQKIVRKMREDVFTKLVELPVAILIEIRRAISSAGFLMISIQLIPHCLRMWYRSVPV